MIYDSLMSSQSVLTCELSLTGTTIKHNEGIINNAFHYSFINGIKDAIKYPVLTQYFGVISLWWMIFIDQTQELAIGDTCFKKANIEYI